MFTGAFERELIWAGDSRGVLRGFPDHVKWAFGRALYKVEQGKRPRIASPLKGRLGGIVELATEFNTNAYRLYYTLKCAGFAYVLYCHQKKSKRGLRIPKHEKKLIRKRFRDAMLDCKERKGKPG